MQEGVRGHSRQVGKGNELADDREEEAMTSEEIRGSNRQVASRDEMQCS